MCTIAMLIWAIFHPAGEAVYLIPSTAMLPTLMLGDYLVTTPAYANGGNPKAGHIAVFRDPRDAETVQIFRVIGLPGDRVQMIDGALWLNGVAVTRDKGEPDLFRAFGETHAAIRYRETLPGTRSYEFLDGLANGYLDNTEVYAVPLGHYFVLGDNRDNSADSRQLNRLGFVPRGNFLGRADRILCSRDEQGMVRPERIGMMIGG